MEPPPPNNKTLSLPPPPQENGSPPKVKPPLVTLNPSPNTASVQSEFLTLFHSEKMIFFFLKIGAKLKLEESCQGATVVYFAAESLLRVCLLPQAAEAEASPSSLRKIFPAASNPLNSEVVYRPPLEKHGLTSHLAFFNIGLRTQPHTLNSTHGTPGLSTNRLILIFLSLRGLS